MDTQLLTLSKIFTERLFRIPDYQRGYAWTDKQLRDFWNYVQQLEPGRNHYTGVLTLETVPEPVVRQWDDDFWIVDAKSYQPFFIVDGQQRLTTAIILIQVILERLAPEGKLNYTEKTDIQRKFIFDSKDGGISRSYVFGYEKDNPSYEFLKTKIFCERSSTGTSEETVYTHNLAQAKQFFSDRVAPLSLEELEGLYRKVAQNLLFNIFTITEDVDVCVAFETMNNKEQDFMKAVRARFRSDGFYNWSGLRYFLFEYNLDLQSRSKTDRRKIFWPEFTEKREDYVSVEHIYPQYARDRYWTSRFEGLSSKQRSALRNSLGNLLPLSKPKNSSLSNKPFPEKVDGRGDPVVGYRYGCYAENEVASCSEWTPREILRRGLKLLSFMEKRWGLELGDERQKKLMLGLDFVKL